MTAPTSTWSPRPFTGTPRPVCLTPVRADVVDCLCLGLDTASMTRELLISRNTLKTHLKHVLRALGARDRHQAAVLVLRGEVSVEIESPA